MLLSKVAMDIEAKHSPKMIAEWRYHDVPQKLWPIKPSVRLLIPQNLLNGLIGHNF